MRDWDQFLEQTPWMLQPGDVASVGEEHPWSRAGVDGLPQVTALLGSATVTPVSISGTSYELLAWGPSSDRRGWLGYPPLDADVEVHPTHRSFWRVSGGIVERFGEPETWWLNQDEILTRQAAAQLSVADVLADASWHWDDEGLTLPIQPDEYYVVAVEANGNLTLAHRSTGQLLLFAQDHAFTGITPLAGCPPYSLYAFNHEPDLASWIENCATVWRHA
jgi:hypothetical protein